MPETATAATQNGFLNISADITLTFALYGCATTKMSGTM